MLEHRYYLEYDEPIRRYEESGSYEHGDFAIHMDWLFYHLTFSVKDDKAAEHYALRFLTKHLWITENGVIRTRRLRTLISRETGHALNFSWDVYYQKIQAKKDAYYRAQHTT